MMTCHCCDRRALFCGPECDCAGGTICVNCKRCERHCQCPFDIREIVFDDAVEPDVEPVIVPAGDR